MDNIMQELFNKLNDKMKEILLVQNPDGESKINYSRLSDALKYAGNPDEENALIEMFLRQSIETDSKWNGVNFEMIEPYKDVLLKLCSELGLKEVQNPFLVFLPEFYNQNKNVNLSRNNMIDLNNLYANDEITKEDLMAKGRDGANNILFNKNLYTFEDVDKMVEYWNWLREPANLKRLNWEEIRNLNLSNTINNVADAAIKQSIGTQSFSDEDWKDVFKNIFFVDNTGKIQSQNTLEKLLSAGSINAKTGITDKQQKRTADVYGDFKKALRNSLANQYRDLSAEDIKEIFADVINELGVV